MRARAVARVRAEEHRGDGGCCRRGVEHANVPFAPPRWRARRASLARPLCSRASGRSAPRPLRWAKPGLSVENGPQGVEARSVTARPRRHSPMRLGYRFSLAIDFEMCCSLAADPSTSSRSISRCAVVSPALWSSCVAERHGERPRGGWPVARIMLGRWCRVRTDRSTFPVRVNRNTGPGIPRLDHETDFEICSNLRWARWALVCRRT